MDFSNKVGKEAGKDSKPALGEEASFEVSHEMPC